MMSGVMLIRIDRRQRIWLAAAALILAVLSGCSTSAESAGPVDRPLPDGVTVAVYQSRSDVASGDLQVQIQNGSEEDLVVTGAAFSAPQFASSAVWRKESTVVSAGRTVDLPVALTAAVCVEGDPAPRVHLEWSVAGDILSSDVVPVDERGRLEELRAAGCFDEAVASIATLSLDTPPRMIDLAGSPAAELDVTVLATTDASRGTVVLDTVSGTTLFTMVDAATGSRSTTRPLGLELGGADSRFTLTLVPTRCDPHAVAEDKQGTIFLFGAEVRPATGPELGGTLTVAAPDAIKQELIAFIGLACGTS